MYGIVMQSTVIMVIIMVICFFGVRMRLISLYDWNILCCWSLHSIVEQLKYCVCVYVCVSVCARAGNLSTFQRNYYVTCVYQQPYQTPQTYYSIFIKQRPHPHAPLKVTRHPWSLFRVPVESKCAAEGQGESASEWGDGRKKGRIWAVTAQAIGL